MIAPVISQDAFERTTDPILRFFTVEQARSVAQFRPDEALQRRVEELATKCNNGELTAEERAEYEGYVRANSFIAVLQAKARKRLAEGGT